MPGFVAYSLPGSMFSLINRRNSDAPELIVCVHVI
jgi:hypothetical protein